MPISGTCMCSYCTVNCGDKDDDTVSFVGLSFLIDNMLSLYHGTYAELFFREKYLFHAREHNIIIFIRN